MAETTAAAVKSLRDRTGLPLLDCKRALQEAQGDEDRAIDLLRKAGASIMQKRAGRETSAGRIAVYVDRDAGVGAMVELKCETAPVANNQEFVQLADDLAKQLALGPGAASAAELLDQPSGGKSSRTLKEQFDDLANRIRENFKLGRTARIDGTCGSYVHHNGAIGVLLQIEGGNAELAKDVCMHIAAMRPEVITHEELDPAEVDKEREILSEAARKEGKPENIVEKMVEGRLRNYYAQHCLVDQPFVKDDKRTVAKVAKAAGMNITGFVHWELGKE